MHISEDLAKAFGDRMKGGDFNLMKDMVSQKFHYFKDQIIIK